MSESDFSSIKRSIDEDINQIIAKYSDQKYHLVTYLISLKIVSKVLGKEWFGKYWKDEKERVAGQARPEGIVRALTIKLAHLLYGLLLEPGFHHKRKDILDNQKRPDDCIWELSVADSLKQNGHNIEFRARTGSRGNDYDLDLRTQDSKHYQIEIKNRDSDINNEATLKNVLNDARKQLPKGGDGVIYVSVPEVWFHDAALVNRIDSIVNDFFRNTARIKYVIMEYVDWSNSNQGDWSFAFIKNYYFQHPGEPTNNLFRPQISIPTMALSFSTPELELLNDSKGSESLKKSITDAFKANIFDHNIDYDGLGVDDSIRVDGIVLQKVKVIDYIKPILGELLLTEASLLDLIVRSNNCYLINWCKENGLGLHYILTSPYKEANLFIYLSSIPNSNQQEFTCDMLFAFDMTQTKELHPMFLFLKSLRVYGENFSINGVTKRFFKTVKIPGKSFPITLDQRKEFHLKCYCKQDVKVIMIDGDGIVVEALNGETTSFDISFVYFINLDRVKNRIDS